jgi:hypothetical protein
MIKPGRDEAASPEPAPTPTDLRCTCGSLLARVFPGGVELKCRRCRRSLMVTLGPDGRFQLAGDLVTKVVEPRRC